MPREWTSALRPRVHRCVRLSWLVAVLSVAAAGCADGRAHRTPDRTAAGGLVGSTSTAGCKQPRWLARAPSPQEVGVYRAGPLLLVTGEDLLVSIGNTSSGCPAARAPRRLQSTAFPFLGIACGSPNSIACDRVGVGVNIDAATLVMVEVAGRFVTLSPPTDAPNDHLWLGYLYGAGLRHGPLDVHISRGATRWFGTPEVQPPVTVDVFFQDGTVGTLTGRGFLHAGFG